MLSSHPAAVVLHSSTHTATYSRRYKDTRYLSLQLPDQRDDSKTLSIVVSLSAVVVKAAFAFIIRVVLEIETGLSRISMLQ